MTGIRDEGPTGPFDAKEVKYYCESMADIQKSFTADWTFLMLSKRLMREYGHRLKEIEELKAILKGIRKTTDGVYIVPGMTVWYWSGTGPIETPKMDSWAELEGMLAEDEMIGPVDYYSTEAAIREALGAEKQNDRT